MITHLIKNERNRPIEEQFPLVQKDIDKLLEGLRLVKISTSRLDRTQSNQDNQLEDIVRKVFPNWLKKNYFKDINVVDIADGILLRRDGNRKAQWDAIIEAEKDGKQYLFLIETKSVGHINDIVPNDSMKEKDKNSTLSRKIEKTLDLFQEVSDLKEPFLFFEKLSRINIF